MAPGAGQPDRTGRGMSEGGRKVWNREQLFGLNNGAIILASTRSVTRAIASAPEPRQVNKGYLDPDEPLEEQITFTSFGWEMWDYVGDLVEEYPIEVIWEPTE